MTCCERPPTTDRTICRACQATTRRKLNDLGGYLAAELEVTLMRADRTTTSPHGKTVGKEQPLPFSERASVVAQDIHATLASWAMLTHDEAGAALPADTTPTLAEHLAAWLGWLVKHDAGDELVHDVARLHRAALDAVDLPPEASRVFVGQCVGLDCPGELWAHFPRATDERPAIRCRVCGEAYDPDSWRRLGERVQARVTQQEAARRLAEAVIGTRNASSLRA